MALLSRLLLDDGRSGDATAALHEAVRLCQDGATARWGPALTEVSVALSVAGWGEQALELARRAVSIPYDEHPEQFAAALANLGVRLGKQGTPEEAVPVLQQAIERYDSLPGRLRHWYAADRLLAQCDLALALGWLGRYEEALRLASDAQSDLRMLHRTLGDHASSRYALLLWGMAFWHGALGRPAEAIPLAQSSVALFGRLVARDPAYEPGLATALHALAELLHRLGRDAEALPPLHEAVRIWRARPGADAELLGPLSDLGRRLWQVGGARSEALTRQREVVAVARRLMLDDPERYEATLARELLVFADWAGEIGLGTDALSAEEEAVFLARRLAPSNEDHHVSLLGGALTELGGRLDQQQRGTEAVLVFQEAVEVLRPLAAAGAPEHESSYTRALSRLALSLAESDPVAAVIALEESIGLYRRLADRIDLNDSDEMQIMLLVVLAECHVASAAPVRAVQALVELADLLPRVEMDDDLRDSVAEVVEKVRQMAPDEMTRRGLAGL